MRDLSTQELGFVYGAGGASKNCKPTPPSCGGGSMSHGKGTKTHGKGTKTRGKGTKCGCK